MDKSSREYFARKRLRLATWSYFLDPAAIDDTGRPAYMRVVDLGVDTLVGMNKVTEEIYQLADKYGIEMFSGRMGTKKEDDNVDPLALNAAFLHHPSFRGADLFDEPGTEDYPWLLKRAEDYLAKIPGTVPFINLLPMYANAAQLKYNANAAAIKYYDSDPDLYRKYCDLYCETFKNLDYICVDIYPLRIKDNVKYTYTNYVESINQVAASARKYGKEFWCCLQAFKEPLPNINEYMFQCYSLMSFGCTCLIWWFYEGTADVAGLIDLKSLKPHPTYYDAQKVISWLKDLSDLFVQYDNLGAFTLNCTEKTPYLKMSNEYKDFDIISEITCDQPLLVGCFDKHEGAGHAFTVVNMSDLKEFKTATVQFKLKRDAVVTSYDQGITQVLTPEDGVYTVKLDWGMGEFLTID